MSAFSRENLELIASGDAYAKTKFVDQVTPKCRRLVKWHLQSWDSPEAYGLVDGLINLACYSFIKELEANGLPADPKARWLKELVRRLYRLRPSRTEGVTP